MGCSNKTDSFKVVFQEEAKSESVHKQEGQEREREREGVRVRELEGERKDVFPSFLHSPSH